MFGCDHVHGDPGETAGGVINQGSFRRIFSPVFGSLLVLSLVFGPFLRVFKNLSGIMFHFFCKANPSLPLCLFWSFQLEIDPDSDILLDFWVIGWFII